MPAESFKDARRAWENIRLEINGWLHGSRDDSKSTNAPPRPAPGASGGAQMSIRQVMTPDPVSIGPDAPLHSALELLLKENLSAVPVVNAQGVVVGLLNERHLLTALGNPDATLVSAVMDPEPVIVGADEPIVEVVDRLMSINVRQVLVLEGTQVVGVITRADLMPAILEVFRERAKRISMVRH